MTIREEFIEIQRQLTAAMEALFALQRQFYRLRELVEELDPEGEK
jgi:hypothetical protein